MAGKISKKQQEILDYIKDCILNKGYPPAVREICEAVNLKSTSSVHSHLDTLEMNGYIRRASNKSRSIEILDEDFGHLSHREVANLPMLGYVAAGEPLYAEEHIEDYFPVPVERLPNAQCFMLKIRGDSMINVGMFDGDYVIVEEKHTADNGEIIVALIEDGATVKRFYKEEGVYRLQPENDDMDPIIVSHVEILGKVRGVLRFVD